MKRLSHENRKGLTLVELLIASSISSMVLVTLCGIYFCIGRDWERQSGEQSALMATSNSCVRLQPYINQAVNVSVMSRFSTGDTLIVMLPNDTANGVYVPTWSGGKVRYRSGQRIAFYLSDSTGQVAQTGNILWAASVVTISPLTVNPDSDWSLYYGGKGRTAPLKSIKFSIDASGDKPRVTLTTVSAYLINNAEHQLSQTAAYALLNAN